MCFYAELIVLGNVTSSCKLWVSGSVLEDLGDRVQGNSPERFRCFTHTHSGQHLALAALYVALYYVSDSTLV